MGKINENSAKSTKTKNVTPAVTPWGKNRVKNTETGKHVLIMPGIGYTVDRDRCCTGQRRRLRPTDGSWTGST